MAKREKHSRYINGARCRCIFWAAIEFLLDEEVSANADIVSFSSGGVWVPVLGRVAGGIPIEAVEDIIDYEEISAAMAAKGEHFGLRVEGDSMSPRILDGDVVIVRKQSDCDTGDVAVVYVNGDYAKDEVSSSNLDRCSNSKKPCIH